MKNSFGIPQKHATTGVQPEALEVKIKKELEVARVSKWPIEGHTLNVFKVDLQRLF